MVWARIDDRANSNAKLIALSDAAFRLWACGLIYCQHNLTDGFVPTHALVTFGVRAKPIGKVTLELTQPLLPGKGPLWHPVEGGWQVHDYLDWNESRQAVLNERGRTKERKERFIERVRNASKNASEVADGTPKKTRLESATTTTTTSTTKDPERAKAPTRELMALFSTLHEARFETPADFRNDRDAPILAGVWQKHGDKTEPLMRLFFESRDPFVVNSGFSVPVFKGQVARLIPKLPTTASTVVLWKDECLQLHGGACEKQWQHDERMKATVSA